VFSSHLCYFYFSDDNYIALVLINKKPYLGLSLLGHWSNKRLISDVLTVE
jgi:hypothetical protein